MARKKVSETNIRVGDYSTFIERFTIVINDKKEELIERYEAAAKSDNAKQNELFEYSQQETTDQEIRPTEIDNDIEFIRKEMKIERQLTRDEMLIVAEALKALINAELRSSNTGVAGSIRDSLRIYKADGATTPPDESLIRYIKAFVIGEEGKINKMPAKERFYLFLSAISKTKDGKLTIDYLAADLLAKVLKELDIGVFWWKDPDVVNAFDYRLIATKIALGLSFATTMVAFGIDTVTRQGQLYTYNCLYPAGDQNSYKYDAKNPNAINYMDYEVDTFCKLREGEKYNIEYVDIFNQQKPEAEFVSEKDRRDFEQNVPRSQERKFFFVTLGEAENLSDYACIKDRADNVWTVPSYFEANTRDDKVHNIVKEVLQRLAASDSRVEKAILRKKRSAMVLKSELQKARNAREKNKLYINAIIDALLLDAQMSANLPDSPAFAPVDPATPSDYFFEYAVIDSETQQPPAENPNTNKPPFTFYVERMIKGRADKGLQLCMVINDWNNAAVEYVKNNPLANMDVMTDKEFAVLDKEKYPLAAYNHVSIYCNPGLEQQSKDELRQTQNKKTKNAGKTQYDYYGPKGEQTVYVTGAHGKCFLINIDQCISGSIVLENTIDTGLPKKEYSFVVNCWQRETIHYTTKVKGNHIVFSFDSTPTKALPLQVICDKMDRTVTPCYFGRAEETTRKMTEDAFGLADLPSTIEEVGEPFALKPGMKRYSIECDGVTVDERYRLYCLNELDRKKFLMIDDTPTNSNCGRLYAEQGVPLRCPYCGELLTKKLKGSIWCTGESQELEGYEGRIICRNNHILTDDVTEVDNTPPKTPLAVPESIRKARSHTASVAILGAPGVGKSVFMSKMFEVQHVTVTSAEVKVDYLNDALKTLFDKQGKNGDKKGRYITHEIAESKQEGSQYLNQNLYIQKTLKLEEKLAASSKKLPTFLSYEAQLFSKYVERTSTDVQKASPEVIWRLRDLPFVLCMKKNGVNNYMSFYDVPGGKNEQGDVETVTTESGSAVETADGIIILLNGAILGKEGADVISEDSPEDSTLDTASKNIEAIIQLKTRLQKLQKGQITDMAVAVVLCKFDKVEKEFDINSHVRMMPPVNTKHAYHNSPLEQYVDSCSVEVEDFVRRYGQKVYDALANFSYVKYFAVSSVGRTDSLGGKDDQARIRYYANPRGLENVVAWLAYQTGIID